MHVLSCAGHFGKEHFPCDHPECQETKFVVFATEQELRKHRMEQHRGDVVEGLSRAERRAALTIPISVNVRCIVGLSPSLYELRAKLLVLLCFACHLEQRCCAVMLNCVLAMCVGQYHPQV